MAVSEAEVQLAARIDAQSRGGRLWRNNVGAHVDNHGRMVRYGLANESKAENKLVKSSDLIGVVPVQITQEMVGSIVGQFVAIECKRSNWKFKGTGREKAQLTFIDLVKGMGGTAGFYNGQGLPY